ncbi:DEAD/DEAH box helicase [Alcaligenaceae bacterium]|nr:DEAD/DEAH box helicase [Alcaligenaceae bacterium]
MYSLRNYQTESIENTLAWWGSHTKPTDNPIIVLPCAAGKSVVIAGLVGRLFELWPSEHPRTLVIVPSKELAEQNAEKLVNVLPPDIRVGYYSASVGKKQPNADVIVATIGSVAKSAHVLGNIKCVIFDECHLISSDGAGMYRSLLNDLAKYCSFRAVGLTATPFRGNGVWLTDGRDPLFTGICHEVTVKFMLENGYNSPLVRPAEELAQIDVQAVPIVNGDYQLSELASQVSKHLALAASQAVQIAVNRKKWIAFCPTVATADEFALALGHLSISAAVVTGDTPKGEREALIRRYRAGQIRCLVTVLALTTGFDVPDVDCIIWLRPTRSPVLYVQGAGRGMRIAPGKTDCLWLDFSDTTERMGPIDAIRGKRASKRKAGSAPFAVCDNCGAQVMPAALLRCPECDHLMREVEDPKARSASDAAILSTQVEKVIKTYPIDDVEYDLHVSRNEGKPDSLLVKYWSGLRVVAREWIALQHTGYAQHRARQWWAYRSKEGMAYVPETIDQALEWIEAGYGLRRPTTVTVNESGKYPEIVGFEWPAQLDLGDESDRSSDTKGSVAGHAPALI